MASREQVLDFIELLGPMARAEREKRMEEGNLWTLPSVCIAQAALETGWGQADIMTGANAFFGIKADEGWCAAGKRFYVADTQECYDGKNYTDVSGAKFRAYGSLQESVEDYFNLICNYPRYVAATCQNDPEACIEAIWKGGYATSPEYVQDIMSIIRDWDLEEWDNPDLWCRPEEKKDAPAPNTYIVRPGDSWWSIAQEVMGDGSRYTELQELNPEVSCLYAGMVLTVPATSDVNPEVAPVQPGESGCKVNFSAGDIVKVAVPIDCDSGDALQLWYEEYEVFEVVGERVVIGVDGVVTSAVAAGNLELVRYA